jgi:hypothetical protein
MRPRVIAIEPTVNNTAWPIDSVDFGGPAQRLLFGSRVYNVPLLLGQALRQSLEVKGYSVTAATGSADAVLRSSVERWRSRRSQPYSVEMLYNLELRDRLSGEVLFSTSRWLVAGGRVKESLASDFLDAEIEGSVSRALASLPEGA